MKGRGRFADRTALVTGTARGMGAQVAQMLAAEGAAVAAVDIDLNGAERTVSGIRESGGQAKAFAANIADRDAVEAVLRHVEGSLGKVAIAVNCAGVIRINPFLELPESDWDLTIDVNLKGTFLILQSVGRGMVASHTRGRMVAIASIAARGPRPDCVDYAASKAGVISLVRSAALALAPHGITVNAICPGIVDTALTTGVHQARARLGQITPEESLERAVRTIPLGRIETVVDVANAVLFLLSDEGSYITGQSLNVCGGIEFD